MPPEEESAGGQQREFEVGVEGMDGDYEHVHVHAESPKEAMELGESEYTRDLTEPVNAYQAFDLENEVTHER